MGWVGHVARVGGGDVHVGFLVGKPERKILRCVIPVVLVQ